jgi:transposase InsO family protein
MRVSRSGYYAWRGRKLSARTQANRELVTAIHEIHRDTARSYGSPRMHLELLHRGFRCGRHRVARLMRAHGIVAERKRRYRRNSGREELYARFDNRLAARRAHGPNQLWVGDYTYLRTPQGWLYLAVVLDLYARRVVGWAFSRQRTANLPREALRMAIDDRKPHPGTLFHSDQGIEYAAQTFQSLLAAHGLEASMSRRGNCYDNAHMESFFASLKLEVGSKFRSAVDAITRIRAYIHFYNYQRRHSSLHYRSPVDHELLSA